MTREKMYELLKKKMDETDWKNLAEIKKYNEYARRLRSQVEWEEAMKPQVGWK